MAYLTTHMRGPAERCRARTPRELTFWVVIEGRRLARKLAPSPHRSREARPTPPSSSRHPRPPSACHMRRKVGHLHTFSRSPSTPSRATLITFGGCVSEVVAAVVHREERRLWRLASLPQHCIHLPKSLGGVGHNDFEEQSGRSATAEIAPLRNWWQ